MTQTVFILLGSLIPPAVLTLFVRWIVNSLIHATAGQISTAANVGLVVIGLATAIVGFVEWRNRERERKRQILADVLRGYFKEYRSEEFGRAVEALMNFQRECKNDPAQIVQAYLELRKNVPQISGDPLHYQRRMVSAFYQEIAIYADGSEEIRNEVYKVWTEGNLSIIPDVLVPIELEAIPISLGNPIVTKVPPVFEAMLRLYEGSKRKA